MKTFTTYAEKKAKQFLNLLQGYTKGIRMTAILILLLMGVNNAWADYYYRGGKNNWGATAMTVHPSGLYEYYKASAESFNSDQFKIAKSTTTYDYNCTYVQKSFNGGIEEIGDYSGDNCYIWSSSKVFIIVYYPNTVINTTNKPIITARTTLYNPTFYIKHSWGNSSWSWQTMSSEGGGKFTYTGNYTDGDGANVYTSKTDKNYITSISGSSDVNSGVPANWTYDAKKNKLSIAPAYTLTVNSEGNGSATGSQPKGIQMNTSYNITATANTGYIFDKWSVTNGSATFGNSTSASTTVTVSGNASATITATFKKHEHTVSYGVCSTTRWGSIKLNSGSEITTSSSSTLNNGASISFTATPNAGYQVEGWYSNSGCTSKITAAGTSTTYDAGTLTADKTVYVKFEAIPVNSHNITYTTEGTGWTYGNSNPTTAEEGATVTFVVNPTAGYRVDVSSDGPTLTGPNANNQYTFTMPTKDVKITVDAKPEQYNVTLNKQSGTGGTSSVTATYAAAMPTITPPARTGYTFNGYFDATSGGTKYYNANGSSAKNWDKTSNTTLYAQWTANTYTVKFNANNGTGTMSNQSFTYDVEKALTANAFTRKGYTFLGWAKSSSATTATYTDKQKVKNLTATNNSTVNLYAVWQALPPTPVILKPNDEWKQANARYAIYYWGDGTDNIGWVEMTDLGCSGEYFTGEVPASYLDFKFVRLDPSGKDDASKNNGLHWDYKWNETEDLTTPAADKNMYDMTSTTITHLYLKPNEWSAANAWFATYLCNGSEAASWHKMTILKDYDNNKEDIYSVEIGSDKLVPSKNKNIIFVRKNPSNTGLNWTDVWNQTADLNMPTDGSNFFSLNDGDWSNGTWSTIYDNSKWTTYTVPTYTININAPESGSIAVTVGGNTTTVTNTPKQITNIAAGTTFTIAYTPNAGFELGHSEVEGIKEAYDGAGTYTVCGPVDITAHFVTKEKQVVYLRPNGTWLSDKAIFYAYVFNRYGDDEWIELTTEETDYTGAYGCTIPAGYSDVIFVRINPTAAEPSWNDNVKWNQSVDYVIPVNTTTNRFIIGEKITAEGTDKDKYQGSWEASDTPIWSIPGDWTGDTQWTAENATPLYGPNGNATLALQASITTEFKLYQFPYGTQERQWYGHAETLVRGNSADKEFTTGTDNCQLVTDIADDYIFAFNIRNKKLTVTYPEIPEPTTSIVSEQRVFEDEVLAGWVAGEGTEANPYQLYADEAVRITVSPLREVEGLTAYYTFGNTAEQTSNIFDWKGIYSTATNLTVTAYYKNANGAKSEGATVTTSYFKTLPLPFNLMTQPKNEINVDQVAAGKNITVQFRSDSRATVDLYIGDTNGTPITTFSNTISKDYEYDVPNDIQPSILTFIAKAKTPVHGRTFEKSVDVVIYKNVIIKVNDPEGWVKNVYTWRDYSDAVLTPWPGDPVLQNYGTWRVFSVKYPYYDRFIINDGNSGGSTQTLDWELPADDTCYELLDPANNGSSDPADAGKYGLKVADCPGNLIVSNIKDTTIMEGEQIVVMPEIFVGLGYKLSDIEADITYNDNTRSVRAMMSGTNITVLGTSEGYANITVTYTLNNERIDQTFKVTVEKKNVITIQVKVPIGNSDDYNTIGWNDNSLIKIHYWFSSGKNADIPLRYVYEEADKYKYMQAEVPLDANGYTNFLIGYNDINENWEKTADITGVTTDGCYTLKNGGWGNSPTAKREEDSDVCWDENDYADYQVKVLMQNGKTYLSNITYSKEAILSFFAPGKDATGRNAGAVMLYRNGKLASSIDPATFDESNVYVATVNETGDGLTNIASYTGNYYIRTWGTDGDINNQGWDSPKTWNDTQKAARKFTYFISRKNEFYNHYWVQAMNTGGYDGKDVSACVANDYNDDLAGKLTKGKGTDESGDIKVGTGKVINVRFGYDPRTNYFGRAIIKGSEYDNYLNIHCDNAYKDKNCSTKLPYGTSRLENKMQDISNWVYQRDFYVPITNSYPSASLYVEATSPSTEMTVTDHLLGYVTNEVTGEESTTPIQRTVIGSGTNNGTYLMRVVYDFKTNRIIAAWVPQGTIEVTDDRTLHADVLFVRKENNDVPQIQLANEGKIRSLESMYFALELERGDKNAANRHEEQYFFTLPFNSIVGSISGVPGYMQTWGIQRYRGDLRAQKGWFIETPTFWEWMSLTDTLYAGEGYALVFDKKAAAWNEIAVDKTDAEGNIMYETNQEGDTIYENGVPKALKDTISMMRLYFPSDTSGFDMQQQSAEHLIRTYENHTCTITREERDKQDSNWKVIGTTSYNNAGIASYTKDTDPEYIEWDGKAPSFRYTYSYTFDGNNNRTSYEYTPELGFGNGVTYKSFFGYMVQFAGTINWQPIMSETVPEGIAARRRVAEGERTSYTTRLELANADGEKQDQTFVALDEKATTTFDQNKDLNKIINTGTNIYTLSEDIPFAGNTLPMEKATVPVGVRIATAGEYTFRMPDGTDGISVILLDNQTGTQTNMLYDEYTVTLDAGTIENRFYLILDPKRTATSLEDVLGDGNEAKGDKAKGVEKFIIDGQLIIRTADGIYDAQGQRL